MMRGLLHELRNPLSSILTAAALLQDTEAPFAQETSPESQTLLEVIGKEATRLNQILTEFDHYIRTPPARPVIFDLSGLTNALISQLQKSGAFPPATKFTVKLPETCLVWADETQIRTALDKLFKNAAEAIITGNKEKEISVQLETASASTARFCLSDSGKGFQQESYTRAFDPFYSTKAQGLGLGLSIAKANIEASAGELWIENEAPGEQNLPTKVCFHLSLASASDTERTKQPPTHRGEE